MTSPEDVELPAPLLLSAESLFERLARSKDAEVSPVPAHRLESLLAPWSRAFARGDSEALAHRLSWDGYSVEQAALVFCQAEAPPIDKGHWTEQLVVPRQESLEIGAEIAVRAQRV